MKLKWPLYIISALLLGLIFWGAASMYTQSQSEQLSFLAQEQAELFVREHSPRYGSPDAKVILTEFLDPECESCREFYADVKALIANFEGKVQLIVRYAPFHGNSKIAIRALEAARLQGKYWPALEMLFHYQPMWGSHHHPRPELIFEYLANLGLDMDRLKKDMKNQKIAAMIEQDVSDLKALKVRATPTFFVNGRPLQRFSKDDLRGLVTEEVQKYYP